MGLFETTEINQESKHHCYKHHNPKSHNRGDDCEKRMRLRLFPGGREGDRDLGLKTLGFTLSSKTHKLIPLGNPIPTPVSVDL